MTHRDRIIVIHDDDQALTIEDIRAAFKAIVAESDIDITKKDMRQVLEDAFAAHAALFDPEDK